MDDELVEKAKRLYGLRAMREVIDLVLRRLGRRADLDLEGTGWDGDIDEMRTGRVVDL